MTTTVQDTLAKIERQAQVLHARTDELTRVIEHIDEALRAANPGVEFWWHPAQGGPVLGEQLRQADGHAWRDGHFLGYARIGTTWGLAVQFFTQDMIPGKEDAGDADYEAVLLTRAARRVRAQAAEHLEKFLDALSEAVAQTLRDVTQAVASLREISEAAKTAKTPTDGAALPDAAGDAGRS